MSAEVCIQLKIKLELTLVCFVFFMLKGRALRGWKGNTSERISRSLPLERPPSPSSYFARSSFLLHSPAYKVRSLVILMPKKWRKSPSFELVRSPPPNLLRFPSNSSSHGLPSPPLHSGRVLGHSRCSGNSRGLFCQVGSRRRLCY